MHKDTEFLCAIVVVYGYHSCRERALLLGELSEIRSNGDCPFLFIGDFNEVLNINERKYGGGYLGSIQEFAQWVQGLGLVDFPLISRKYTWSRGNSCRRLDRGLVYLEWTLKFPDLKLRALGKLVSDHCPLFLETNSIN